MVAEMTSFERWQACYAFEPLDHLPRRPFYFWPQTIERWEKEGMDTSKGRDEIFGFDPFPLKSIVRLGWVDSPFVPAYEKKVIADEGDYEIVQDSSGRHTRKFKDIDHGVMPTYTRSCVRSRADWENDVRPRLDWQSPERWTTFDRDAAQLRRARERRERLPQLQAVGGYMHLRNLFGPEDLLYVFHDDPALVREVMCNWLDVVLNCAKKLQSVVPIFQLFLAEDICFKTGPLISPAMVREFLIPCYRDLFQELQGGQDERLHFHVDTDGDPAAVMEPYFEAGMDMMSPFEVAAGCDVVEYAKKYPDLIISGGIDKRILATTKDAIRREVERILPFMAERGGYIPTCDHGVPPDVSFENYMYYRELVMQMDH